MPRAPLALALALALALPGLAHAAPPSLAQLTWRYHLSIPDPASGNVHVTLSVEGANEAMTHLVFGTNTHRTVVANVTGGPRTPIQPTNDGLGIEFDIDGDESFSYDVKAERVAFNDPAQRLEHVGADFALVKAESLTLEYSYSYYQGVTFQNRTIVELAPPAGWDAAAPWAPTPTPTPTPTPFQSYDLGIGSTLPRGYVAMGRFLADSTHDLAGKHVRYVRLGHEASFEAKDAFYHYLEKATPYYTAVYGPGVRDDILVVNAPDPMFHGGLGGADSFFVHEESDLRTVAHEYAHVFQLFASTETQGESTIWLNEGDADYHSALSLYAAEVWTPDRVNDFLHRSASDATDPSVAAAKLPLATYGSPFEQFAYHKGAIVLRALDVLLHDATGGQRGLSDVLQRLNELHGDPTSKGASQPVTNEEIERVASEVLGADLHTFFAENITGSLWPLPFAPFVAEGQFATAAIDVQPARPQAGDPIMVSANVTNRGTERLLRNVEVLVDGARVASQELALDVGEARNLTFPLLALAPGDHEVRVLAANASYHTLTPPAIAIDHFTFSPARIRQAQDVSLFVFLQNAGEAAGTARLEALGPAGASLARSTETIVDGGGSATVNLILRFDVAGATNVSLALVTPQGNSTRELTADVLAPDAPAARDVPTSGEVGGASAGGQDKTPLAPWLALAALGGVALARRKRA